MPDTDQTTPKPADLDTFDLDGFIAGAVRPTKTVPIAQDRTLGNRITQARQAILDLERQESLAKATGSTSKRRAASTESPAMETARAELTAAEEAARGTWVFVRVESVNRKNRKTAISGVDPDSTEAEAKDVWNLGMLAECATIHTSDPTGDPTATGQRLTFEQWDDLTTAIGLPQYESLVEALSEVSVAGVSPDFSRPASPSPAGDTSAKS